MVLTFQGVSRLFLETGNMINPIRLEWQVVRDVHANLWFASEYDRSSRWKVPRAVAPASRFVS
jgi:hypothetical protein